MRTRRSPCCCVRQRATPRSPLYSVAGTVDQSVVAKAMPAIFMVGLSRGCTANARGGGVLVAGQHVRGASFLVVIAGAPRPSSRKDPHAQWKANHVCVVPARRSVRGADIYVPRAPCRSAGDVLLRGG